MSINQIINNGKNSSNSVDRDDIVTVIIILLVGIGAFGLGRLSVATQGAGPIKVRLPAQTIEAVGNRDTNGNDLLGQGTTTTLFPPVEKKIVASRSGKKYHFPWCAGARTISEANKIWFSDEVEARKAGYTAASNCKGLK